MAFATSNVGRSAYGDVKVTRGYWTGSKGDASGTMTIEGGTVWAAEFSIQDPTGPTQYVPWEVSASGTGTVTVTVHNRQTVARGRFRIEHT